MSQLALAITLDDYARFETFYPAGNEQVLSALKDVQSPGLWLSGPGASGKSHLLQAVCAAHGPDSSAYVAANAELAAGIIDGLDSHALVCIDDIDVLAGSPSWEIALFELFNLMANSGGALVLAANAPVAASGFELPDLTSRFSALPAYRLQALADQQAIVALQLRAQHRGLELPQASARYIYDRMPRDMQSLNAILQILDSESLAAKRRLTVPFVREIIRRRKHSGD